MRLDSLYEVLACRLEPTSRLPHSKLGLDARLRRPLVLYFGGGLGPFLAASVSPPPSGCQSIPRLKWGWGRLVWLAPLARRGGGRVGGGEPDEPLWRRVTPQ